MRGSEHISYILHHIFTFLQIEMEVERGLSQTVDGTPAEPTPMCHSGRQIPVEFEFIRPYRLHAGDLQARLIAVFQQTQYAPRLAAKSACIEGGFAG